MRFGAAGLIAVAIGLIVIWLMSKFKVSDYKIAFMYVWTGGAMLWSLVALLTTGAWYIDRLFAMVNEKYEVVEGVVENFDPMPYSGHRQESFTVKGVKFKYSDYGPSPGFNNTRSHGGPIDEGKYVRIYHYKGDILQLWVEE